MVTSRRISSVRKSGIREVFDRAERMKNIINLGIGEPAFRTPSFIVRAAVKALERDSMRYTTTMGILELREEIARKLKKENGIDADPKKEIIVTAGATQACLVYLNSILDPGDEVLIPSPSFVLFRTAVGLAGGKAVEVEMDEREGYRLDLEKLRKRVTGRTKLLVLNSPSNPTGAVYSEKDLVEACEFAVSNKLHILSDEVYEKFVYDGGSSFSPASLARFRESVTTLNSFSKTYSMTGWRIGYAAGPEEVIDAMTRFNMYNEVSINGVSQAAAIAALRGPQSFINGIRARFNARRRLVVGALRKIGLKFAEPRGAFYVFPNTRDFGPDSATLCKRLLEEHSVATIPGESFGTGGEAHFRLSYVTTEEELRVAMERMAVFFGKLKQAGRK
jgi:aminotransferase